MIEQLTPEQEAKFPFYVDKWLKIGLATGDCDFEQSKEAAKWAYRLADLKEPTEFYLFDSPLQAARETVKIRHGKYDKSKQREEVDNQIYGCHDASWLSFYDFFLTECNLECCKKLEGLMELAKHCGWWAPFDTTAIFQHKPDYINLDDRDLLHAEDKAAISYRDGLKVFAWHGQRVPEEWIMDKSSITPEICIKWDNIEQRRAACEILGWDAVIELLDPTIIDTHENPQIGVLMEANIPDIGKEKFLKVQCGTGRTFALPVPMEMRTAHEANAWTYGMSKDDYYPEVRT